jgi:ATP-dependent Zn protease
LGLTQEDSGGPVYLEIKSDDAIKKFTGYYKTERLNPKSVFKDGFLYISKYLIAKDWIVEDDMEVSVNVLETNGLINCESITIKLNENDVNIWSEDEANKAANAFKLSNQISFNNQTIWIKPGTKAGVIGVVSHIYPSPKHHLDAVFISKKETMVIFEGLPENKQKVIDFSKIGGLSHLIDKLRETIQIPINFPELLTKFGITPPKGLLMYGPPGNGKTLVAKAVAQSMGANFIII